MAKPIARRHAAIRALATVLLVTSACATPSAQSPTPEGKDWRFVAASARRSWVSVSQSTTGAGYLAVTTTTTSAATLPALVIGIARPKPLALGDLGNRELLRRNPALAQRAFRPISELP